MKRTLVELSRFFCLEDMSVDANKSDTYHNIKHSFREEIILPIAAIGNNVDFLLYKGVKHVKTSDAIECIVEEWEEVHICDLEKDIQRIYNSATWPFILKWRKFEPCMTSMNFIKMKLKKDETSANG